jgi:hypothetical protein
MKSAGTELRDQESYLIIGKNPVFSDYIFK